MSPADEMRARAARGPCQCERERHFADGSVSTTEETGRFTWVCGDCGLYIHQTRRPEPERVRAAT